MKESTFRTVCYVSMSLLLLIVVVQGIFIFQNNQQIDTIRKELSGRSETSQAQSQMTTDERMTNIQTQLNDLKDDVSSLDNQVSKNNSNAAAYNQLQSSVSSLNNRVDQLETKQQKIIRSLSNSTTQE